MTLTTYIDEPWHLTWPLSGCISLVPFRLLISCHIEAGWWNCGRSDHAQSGQTHKLTVQLITLWITCQGSHTYIRHLLKCLQPRSGIWLVTFILDCLTIPFWSFWSLGLHGGSRNKMVGSIGDPPKSTYSTINVTTNLQNNLCTNHWQSKMPTW